MTHWHGDSDTEQILAVPNAAPPAIEARPPLLGLTTFAPAGALAPAPTATDAIAAAITAAATDPAAGPGSAGVPEPSPEKRPGEWQSAYWSQRKAATAERDQSDTAGIDPAAMSRTIDLLGPIDLSGSPGTAGSRAADLAEVAAFIALHPYCSANQVAAELWPGRSGAVTIRDAQIARLRDWLGTDAYGENHLETTEDGGYRMGPSVSCDWLEFTSRVKNGELVSAISLIRGRPFQGAPLRRYGWAESLRQEMTALIIDTAHFVAEACLREQNPRGAQTRLPRPTGRPGIRAAVPRPAHRTVRSRRPAGSPPPRRHPHRLRRPGRPRLAARNHSPAPRRPASGARCLTPRWP